MKFRPGFGLIPLLVIYLASSAAVLAKSAEVADYGFTSADKENYLTEAEMLFIRPGLEIEIMDVVIPDDRQLEVTFKIADPAGLPLDRDGVYTPGPVSTSFILSYIPEGETAYVAYTTRAQTSPITGDSAVQATSDSGGTYTAIEDGMYMYKFGTILPEGYDTNATHTLGMYARRDLREWDLDRYVDNALEHFVPSAASEPMPRSIVTTQTCNGCHDPLAIHGGSRQEVGLCILCHNPTQSIDPDTGDSVDMPYMVHKIHAGEELENGYTIVGYRQSVHDYSHVVFPGDLNNCTACHSALGGDPTDGVPLMLDPNPAPSCVGDGLSMTDVAWADKGSIEIRVNAADGALFASSGGANNKATGKWVRDHTSFFMVDAGTGEVIQEMPADTTVFGCATNPPGAMYGAAAEDHTAWMTNPSRMACGSCHDDIDFENGIEHIPQANDDACNRCHEPDSGGEYDFSVAGAHTVNYRSTQLSGFLLEILDIQDTGPGDNPTVTFKLWGKSGAIDPQTINRLRFSISGPNTDFTYWRQEDALEGMRWTGSNYVFTFDKKLPSDAMGSFSFGVEGRLNGQINGQSQRDQMQNFIEPFAVTDSSAMSRRVVVDDVKCESCHSNLSLHGSNRHNATEYCQTCHNPTATDEDERLEGIPESIDFRYMIHKIHRGAELENGYVVYGHNNSVHDYGHVEYVGDLRNCDACHVDDSQLLPLPAGLSSVTTPADLWSPMGPVTAACVSCHDSDAAKAHADNNTSEYGEACSTCHGTGKTYAVEKVHAR